MFHTHIFRLLEAKSTNILFVCHRKIELTAQNITTLFKYWRTPKVLHSREFLVDLYLHIIRVSFTLSFQMTILLTIPNITSIGLKNDVHGGMDYAKRTQIQNNAGVAVDLRPIQNPHTRFYWISLTESSQSEFFAALEKLQSSECSIRLISVQNIGMSQKAQK